MEELDDQLAIDARVIGLVDRGRCAFAELLDNLITPDLAHRGIGRADRAARQRARGIDDERAAVGKRGGRERRGVGLVGPGTVLWIVSHESSPQPPAGSMVRKKIISPVRAEIAERQSAATASIVECSRPLRASDFRRAKPDRGVAAAAPNEWESRLRSPRCSASR